MSKQGHRRWFAVAILAVGMVYPAGCSDTPFPIAIVSRANELIDGGGWCRFLVLEPGVSGYVDEADGCDVDRVSACSRKVRSTAACYSRCMRTLPDKPAARGSSARIWFANCWLPGIKSWCWMT